MVFFKHPKDSINSFVNNKDTVSLYYKVGKDSYEIGTVIDEYAKENNMENVYIAFPLNIINSTFMSKRIKLSPIMGDYGPINNFVSRDYFTQMWNEDKYKYAIYFYLSEPWRYFDDWKFENAIEQVPKLEEMLKESNTDVFVMTKWEGREEASNHLYDYLTSFATIFFGSLNSGIP